MDTLTAIATRKSIRNYKSGSLSKEQLNVLLTAAQASPFGMGQYENVRLTVVQNKEYLAQIDAAFGKDKHLLYGAATLIIITAKNPSQMEYIGAGAIAQNIALAATALDLGSCDIMGAMTKLEQNATLQAKLGIPTEFVPCFSVAIGETTENLVKRDFTKKRIAVDIID